LVRTGRFISSCWVWRLVLLACLSICELLTYRRSWRQLLSHFDKDSRVRYHRDFTTWSVSGIDLTESFMLTHSPPWVVSRHSGSVGDSWTSVLLYSRSPQFTTLWQNWREILACHVSSTQGYQLIVSWPLIMGIIGFIISMG
jgi:hypothetical protein